MQRQEQKSSALDEQLKEYIAEWRKQRAKEEEDLKRLKEKQSKRKVWYQDITLCCNLFKTHTKTNFNPTSPYPTYFLLLFSYHHFCLLRADNWKVFK